MFVTISAPIGPKREEKGRPVTDSILMDVLVKKKGFCLELAFKIPADSGQQISAI